MRGLAAQLLIATSVAGCTSQVDAPKPSVAQARAAQLQSQWGPVTKWRLASAPWAQKTQSMRDRAYIFRLHQKPTDKHCAEQQDFALIAANQAEIIAASAMRNKEYSFPYAQAIHLNPSSYIEARAFCLEVYKDAGSGDVRSLGPCLQNAVGGDYFLINPVP